MSEEARRPTARLLVVDDSESNRFTLQVLLEDAGFTVDTAPSFREAEKRLVPEGSGYQMFLLDEHLGDGLGSKLVPLIRERQPRARLVLMRGSLRYSDELPPDGFVDGILDKNSDFPQVLEMLNKLLE